MAASCVWLIMKVLVYAALVCGAASVVPVGPASTFVQLFEWSWDDVAQECEQWLGPKGFSAVQVSPPMEHIAGSQWWTRYQPVSYNLTSRSGSPEAFAAMIQRCAKVGVHIFVDAVINHAAAGSGVGIAGSPYGNRMTVLYGQEDFHHNSGQSSANCAVTNYQDQHNVQDCDLVGLPDLCTGCAKVQDTIARYLGSMLSLGVAGFRIDAAKHQEAGELGQLLAKVPGGTPYVYQEVISGQNEAVTPNMYVSIGQVTEFNYARKLAPNIIDQGKLKFLSSFGESWGLLPRAQAVVFLDNHDTQRGEAALTYKSGDIYNLANVFMLAHPYGFPKVMSSYYFDSHDQGPPSQPVHGSSGLACGDGNPWVCEHRRPMIANMVAWRQSASTADVNGFASSDDGNGLAFCRGQAACVAINRGSNTWQVNLKVTMPPGKYHEVLCASDASQCPQLQVGNDGYVQLQVASSTAVAFHVGAQVVAVTSEIFV